VESGRLLVFELLLIRHAQSANNALDESLRVPDPGITEMGKRQAICLSEWLKTYPPTTLYCSGFRRALETTLPIAQSTGIKPFVRQDIFEWGGCYDGYLPGKMGPFPGMNRAEIEKQFPGWEIDERIGDAGWYTESALESDEMALERSRRVASWLRGMFENLYVTNSLKGIPSRVALVIHADFKALLLRTLLNDKSHFGERTFEHLSEVPNTSVTQLTWTGDDWRLDFWSSIGHLPGDLMSR